MNCSVSSRYSLVFFLLLGIVPTTWAQTSGRAIAPKSTRSSPNAEKRRVLIVTGMDYPGHKWRETTPVLEKAIGEDPRLEVSITEEPAFLASPKLHDYDVVVLHFMDWEQPDPGAEARANLQRFVSGGKGLVLVHFACGAFQKWPEFEDLAGRVWDPKLPGHDPRGPFRVVITETGEAHPATRGMSAFETDDELYTCLRGSRPISLLATATSKRDGKDHPMAFAFDYGKGRVFHSPLGHDPRALRYPGTSELFRRGTAWAAGLRVATRSATGESWAIEADLAESCCCLPACPCLFGSPPTLGYCHGSRLVEIKRGHYGATRLDGKSFVLTFRMGAWTKIYVSDKCSEGEARAIEELVKRLNGFVFGSVKEVKRVPLSVERTEGRVKFSVPASRVEIEVLTGREGRPIKIENVASFEDYTQYKSVTVSHQSREEAESFEHSGTNGFTSKYRGRKP